MRDLHQGLDKADELSGATRERRASSPLIALHADRGSGHDGGAPRDAALRPSSRSASGLVGSPAFDRGPEPTLEVLPSLLPAQQRAWAAAGQRAYGNRAIASMLSRVPDGAVLSRKCASCKDEDEDEDKRVSRSAEGAAPAAIPAAVHRVLDAPGAPLAASVRSFMEPRFGALLARTGPLQAPSAVRGISVPDDPHEREADRVAHTIVNARVRDDAPRADLGDVRVHAGADAAAAARAVSAEAFSVGSHIVLGAGHEPASATRLLAHAYPRRAGIGRDAGAVANGVRTRRLRYRMRRRHGRPQPHRHDHGRRAQNQRRRHRGGAGPQVRLRRDLGAPNPLTPNPVKAGTERGRVDGMKLNLASTSLSGEVVEVKGQVPSGAAVTSRRRRPTGTSTSSRRSRRAW